MFRNTLKTVLLLAGLSGMLLWVGERLAGEDGLVTALVVALAMNVGTYWFSDRLALVMAYARPAEEWEYPWYHAIVRHLARRAGQPVPRLYISPSAQPNAFATGRNPRRAAVCLNRGLIELLDREEIEAVLAHELSHVYNRDILIGTIAATLASAVTFVARLALFFGGDEEHPNPLASLLLVLLAPVAAVLVQFAVTRSRESQADLAGAHLCGNPLALASALYKIEASSRMRGWQPGTPAETRSAYSSLYIAAPLSGSFDVARLFRTHPPTEERIRALQALARQSRRSPAV